MEARHPLIRSEAAARALALLSSAPGQEVHTRELIRRTATNPRSMQIALENLEAAGFLQSRRVGNLRLWRIESSHPLYASLRDLFARTRGVPALLEKTLRADPGVELAFIFGSFVTARDDPTSDIDLFVVGDVDWTRLSKVIADAARLIGRDVRPIVWSGGDLAHATEAQQAFLDNIVSRPKMWLVGNDHELGRRRGVATRSRGRRAASGGVSRRRTDESPPGRAERSSGADDARRKRARRRGRIHRGGTR